MSQKRPTPVKEATSDRKKNCKIGHTQNSQSLHCQKSA